MEGCVIFCSVSSKDEAVKISKELVKSKLIACCNIVSSVTSVYEWEANIHCDSEVLMIMKTKSNLFEQVRDKILDMHSYEVPEIISVPIDNINESYRLWLETQTRQ